MSQRNVLQGGFRRLVAGLPGGATRLVAAGLAVASLAAPASAYVVVTSDNRVYEVSTKPEVRGDLVLFQLDGQLVSLRIYDVNVPKTNELNHLADSGGAAAVTAQARHMRPSVPQDERLMGSSRLDVLIDGAISEDSEIVRREMPAEMPSFDRDRPGRRQGQPAADSPGSSDFSKEARAALDEARRRQSEPAEPAESSTRSRRSRGADSEAAPSAPRGGGRDAAKVSELDAEIKAEQEYLRKLTSGEQTVADLEGEIDRSMAKVKRLQKRRDAAAADAAEVASEPSGGGDYPSGSREAKWDREIREAQAELQRLKGQQANAEGREREGIDERIGELQWKIDRLQKKLAGGE